jgi:hypothetical protein
VLLYIIGTEGTFFNFNFELMEKGMGRIGFANFEFLVLNFELIKKGFHIRISRKGAEAQRKTKK